jgi:CRISPR-associated protein Csx17
MEPLYLPGCRHDILGHYLKAIGLLRVLAKCADEKHRDSDAEGWWDSNQACFCLRSTKYDTREKLAEFFEKYYRPTPVFAAWNKEPGSTAEESQKLGAGKYWEIANRLSVQVVTADKRKKPENKDKLIASQAWEAYRDTAASSVTEAMDCIASPFFKSNQDSPLFLSKGIAGRAHIFRTHWNYLSALQKLRSARKQSLDKVTIHESGDDKLASLIENADAARQKVTAHNGAAKKLAELTKKAEASQQKVADYQARMSKELAELKAQLRDAEQALADLIPTESGCSSAQLGKGTPFFPDAIKAYNIGSGWVTEKFPFNALDYVLAVEGGFAMRGSVGRTLAANSKRFAAFPFVFDAGEDLVNKDGDTDSTASALWFPLWDRPVTFAELSSFITDAQARLPGKEARFSAEFMRALHSQGVDAGFTGWQEFRFKQRVTDVPWITTGAYVESAFREDATRLNRALHPLDESHFLDQFEMKRAGGKADSRSPHPVRSAINAAMETATLETTPYHCLDLLCAVFRACRQMAISESFRETLPGKRARFFRPLPMEDWNHLLRDMSEPEFRIARAVASMAGHMKQRDGKFSKVLPMLGSLLPLKSGRGGVWYLPQKSETPSRQAVWTGTDICHDLAAVLARRYLDSLKDDRPALVPPHDSLGARLSDVLAFLNGELDDQLIARWIEALNLIGWDFVNVDPPANSEPESYAIPPEYAALRALLELECERREEGDTKKRRSQQPIALLCQRSASTLPLAVTEALRWIAIWGVPNPDREEANKGRKRLAGRDIISPSGFSPSTDAIRLAAAVSIPLHWRDRNALYRTVSLPQTD